MITIKCDSCAIGVYTQRGTGDTTYYCSEFSKDGCQSAIRETEYLERIQDKEDRLLSHQPNTRPNHPTNFKTPDWSPGCPLCTNEMRPQYSQYGKFYGCKRFPRCKGKMSAAKFDGLRLEHLVETKLTLVK